MNGNYLNTWSNDVVNEPSFKMILNSGQSELKIRLAREAGDYGEDEDVKFNNEVDCYIVDNEAPNGLLIYSGYISDYQPSLDASDEYIEITALGYVTELENTTFIDTNGNTAKVYSGEDPKNIISDILTLYNGNPSYGKVIAGSMDATGFVRDYTFNNTSNQQAIDKTRELCPSGWWWYVDEQKKLNLHAKSSIAKHTFIVGRHITKMDGFKTMRDLKNAVRFIGGVASGESQFYKVYDKNTTVPNLSYLSSSESSYGRREYVMVDTRVIDEDTADAMATAYLETYYEPAIRATIDILDNNGDNQNIGYDIESIKPGDTCRIIDPKFQAGSQSYALNKVMIIQTVQYDFDKVTLELSVRPPWVAKRIQDIYRDLNKSVLSQTPPAPSGVEAIDVQQFGNATYGTQEQPNILTAIMSADGQTGCWIDKTGVYAKKNNIDTFRVDAETGDACFGGTLTAGISIISPIITGGTVQTASSGDRVILNGNTNQLEFYHNDDLLGYATSWYFPDENLEGIEIGTASGESGTYIGLSEGIKNMIIFAVGGSVVAYINDTGIHNGSPY
jgi:hypothetical protein